MPHLFIQLASISGIVRSEFLYSAKPNVIADFHLVLQHDRFFRPKTQIFEN